MTNEDSQKLRALYELYEQPMYRVAFAVLKNTQMAEDAVSEAFMHIIGKLGRIKAPDSERTKRYIIRTIKNTSINCYRKNRRALNRETPIDESVLQIADTEQNVEERVINAQGGGELEKMLGSLNDTDRNIIKLRCVEEMSWKEVASSLSLTEANARKRFERSKKRLINMKGETGDEK